jgi:antitoxin component of MazEF toxin-antitoxin module
MSDLSVLSHEYKRVSELSQVVNQALIALKKVYMGLSGAEAITDEELDASRHNLAEVLTMLIGLLQPTTVRGVVGAAAMRVPQALVARLRAERGGDLAYYLDDLRRVVARLRDKSCKLTDADFALLDQLAAAADAETSSVFRLLMRK